MKKLIIFLFLLTMLSSIVYADCPPSVPVIYKGDVLYNGKIISGNFNLSAFIGEKGNLGIVNNGKYQIEISSCYGVNSGNIIFYVNSIQANEMPLYRGQEDWGKEITMDLTLNSLPSTDSLCGNGKIDAGEVCDGSNFSGLSCSSYGYNSGTLACSSCINIIISGCYNSQGSSGNNAGGSNTGGGGGGSLRSYSSASCVENWQCTVWSSCEDGKQRRTCTDSNKCGASLLKPVESKECEEETLKLNTSSEQKSFFSGITGAVTGVLGTAGTIGVLVFIIAIVVIAIFTSIMRRRQASG